LAVGKSNQPAVGNGDAMSVSAEIAQHVFWPAERPFGVDDPVVTEQYPQPCGEGGGSASGRRCPWNWSAPA
jgi:hypothetical protein